MRDRITWPGVVLGVYSQRWRPSATMRSPFGSVNRIAKRLGRIGYSRARVVSGAAIMGFATTCRKAADRVALGWEVWLAWARAGRGAWAAGWVRGEAGRSTAV